MSQLNKSAPKPSISAPSFTSAVAKATGNKLAVSANNNVQFAKTPHHILYELVTSSLLGRNTFYNTGDVLVARLVTAIDQLVAIDEFDFIANAAIHARTEMHIRSMPIVLVVQFAAALRKRNKTFPAMRRLTSTVISRADELTDMLSYALQVFGGKQHIPSAIKKGIADACNKFNEYQYGKYNRKGKSVTFSDLLRIVHPVANTIEQGALYANIIADTVPTPYTWETELSNPSTSSTGWCEVYSSAPRPTATPEFAPNVDLLGGMVVSEPLLCKLPGVKYHPSFIMSVDGREFQQISWTHPPKTKSQIWEELIRSGFEGWLEVA
jgi:hypothetical protein